MRRCLACARQAACRVPRELHRFSIVAHRLEQEHRDPALQERLRFFVERADCLVEAGYIKH